MSDKPEGTDTLTGFVRAVALFGAAAALDAARRAGTILAGYLVAGLLLAASLAFLTLSGYRVIAQGLGEIYAALIVGCAYFVAALMVIVFAQSRRR